MDYISVLIPCFNDEHNIGLLINSIQESSDFIGGKDEIIVIDDKSNDDSVLVAQQTKVNVIKLKKNSGPAVARNAGAKSAKNPILLFLDSDTRLENNSLKNIRQSFTSKDKRLIVNGLCLPEPINYSIGSFYKGLVEYSWHLDVIKKNLNPSIFNSRVGAIRKDFYHEIGGFDENIRGTELEEHEFSYRLPDQTEIELNSEIKVRHDFPGFTKTLNVYWKRSAKWADLFIKNRKFDNDNSVGGTSFLNGLGHLFGVFVVIAFICAILFPIPFFFLFAGLFFLFVYINRLFFGLAVRVSIGKLIAVLCLHLLYSLVIFAGVMYGIIRFILNELRS
jgi:glycosyltransferase involved in cell wall biosynthesis